MKKFVRKYRKFIAILGILILAAGTFHSDFLSFAAPSTQQQIDAAEKEKEELENQQSATEDELTGLKIERDSLQGQLNELNYTLNDVCANLEDLEDRIMLKTKDIQDAEAALNEAIEEEEYQYACMVIRLRAMYERYDGSFLNSILSAGSLEDLLNVADYYEAVASYDREKLKEFKENRALIEEEKLRLEGEYAELETLQAAAEEERIKVAELIEQTQTTITEYQSSIADTEAEIEAYEAAIKKKEEDLEYLYKVLEEEKRLSQLAANSTWRDISDITFTEDDRYLLANLIYCEAGGEPYEGQVAVGAVVINRLLSSRYPDTLSGVVYQPWQFSPAASGRLALALANNKATASCYKAADEAMSGYSNVGNCVYFRTPIPGLTGIQIGGHIFY